MAIAPVLKTGVRKDFWVRIPGPPLNFFPVRVNRAPSSDILLDRSCLICPGVALASRGFCVPLGGSPPIDSPSRYGLMMSALCRALLRQVRTAFLQDGSLSIMIPHQCRAG